MDESNFEGTLVLEKIAENNQIDDFYMAIDSDDFDKAKRIMMDSGVSKSEISEVLRMMRESEE